MDRIFKLKENNATVKNEIIGGVTTFLSMAYILAVNPGILKDAGMPEQAVFAATAISAPIFVLFFVRRIIIFGFNIPCTVG